MNKSLRKNESLANVFCVGVQSLYYELSQITWHFNKCYLCKHAFSEDILFINYLFVSCVYLEAKGLFNSLSL